MTEENIVIIDKKLVHKGMIHKLAENGGDIKFNKFGIRIAYNPNNPLSPMAEAQLFVIPIGTTFTGKINPSLARIAAKKEEKQKALDAQEDFEPEEQEELIM